MKRAHLIAIGAVTGVGVVIMLAPLGLRRIEFFRVRQVELVGLTFMDPEVVLRALDIPADRNVFDDNTALRDRAEALPGVAGARVERRLPGTLRLVFEERLPVAFARGEWGLLPLDGDGRPLPYDPTVSALDLPLVKQPDTALVRALSLARATDSVLFSSIDGARLIDDNTLIFEFGEREIVMRSVPSLEEWRAVEAVRRHLATSGRPYAQIDARFSGWVVVREGA